MSTTSKKVFLIQSPDKYFDVVPIFLAASRSLNFFDKYYIATDRKVKGLGDDCQIIQLDKDYNFCGNIIRALPHVEEDVFFMDCEDHIQVGFENAAIQTCYEGVLADENIGCLRLTKKVRLQLRDPDALFSAIVRPDPFYVSLQPTIWRKSYLEQIIRDGENAWQFEKMATQRALAIDKPEAYIARRTLYNTQNFFKQGGRYRPGYIKYANEHGIELDANKFYDEWKLHDRTGRYDYISIHGCKE